MTARVRWYTHYKVVAGAAVIGGLGLAANFGLAAVAHADRETLPTPLQGIHDAMNENPVAHAYFNPTNEDRFGLNYAWISAAYFWPLAALGGAVAAVTFPYRKPEQP